MNSLYDQLAVTELKSVAILIGFDSLSSGFRNNLREIEALPKPFTIGDAARAYVAHVANQLNRN